MSKWRDACRDQIARLTADLPADATVEQRRKVLWGKGFPAHQGTVWGRRMWGQEVRKYLAGHGDSYVRLSGETKWPEHIHFPFRSAE